MKLFTNSKRAFFAALAGLTVTANAASISMNFGPSRGDDGPGVNNAEAPHNNVLSSTTSAGVVPSTNWNDKTEAKHGNSAVADDSGTLLTTTVSVQTSWTNGVVDHDTTDGNNILMNGGLDNGGGPQGATIVGVPYSLYDVYIYFDGGNTNKSGTYTVNDTDNGDAVLATQNAYDRGTWGGTFVEASTVGIGGTGLDANGDPVGSNYVHFTGLTAPNIKVLATAFNHPGEGTPRAPINGIQIVESIPEPSSMMLALLGLIGFVSRRKR